MNAMRQAGNDLNQNQSAQSTQARKQAAELLDQYSQALQEKPQDPEAELKKKKATTDTLEKIADAQDELRKKTKKAEQIADPKARAEELQKLAREQEKLREKVEQELMKLTREGRDPETAEQLRQASEQMTAAREQLEQGKSSDEKQADALDKLDEATNKLDRDRKDDAAKLSQEKRGELQQQLQALRDRLQATDDEANRIYQAVLQAKKWDNPKLTSLGDIEQRAGVLAGELRTFSEKNLEPLPVFQQLVDQASVLTDQSSKRFAERKDDVIDAVGLPFDNIAENIADDRCRRPLKTALRRINHVLNSLKEDPKQQANAPKPMNTEPQPPMPMNGEPDAQQQQGVQQIAQVKALRSIQAELNERTAGFAKAHPDSAKYSPADREELQELERSQREVAELFRKIASTFQNPTTAPEMP